MLEVADESALLLSFRDRLQFQELRGRLTILDGESKRGRRSSEDLARQTHLELAAESR